MRGYEFYVVDGEDFYLSKTALKYAIIKNKKHDLPYLKMKQFKNLTFPFMLLYFLILDMQETILII